MNNFGSTGMGIIGGFLLIVLPAVMAVADPGTPAHLYATGRTMEIDRCASAWLIKRYVDPKAHFKFYPDGELITEGTPFDTPEAELRRTHNQATFEVIMARYGLKEEGLAALARSIHEIEIGFWATSGRSPETTRLETTLGELLRNSETSPEAMQACFSFLDNYINPTPDRINRKKGNQ
jgi:hypothetical protein